MSTCSSRISSCRVAEQLNGKLKEADALSVNDFFIKAASLALRKVWWWCGEWSGVMVS